MRLPLIAFVSIVLVSSDAMAQPAIELAPATRIRYSLTAGQPQIEAQVVVQRGDSVLVRRLRTGDRVSFALHELGALDVSRGQTSRVRSGVAIGLLAGAMVGLLRGRSYQSGCSDAWCVAERNKDMRRQATTDGILGLLVGGFIGARLTVDHWEALPLVPSVRASAQ